MLEAIKHFTRYSVNHIRMKRGRRFGLIEDHWVVMLLTEVKTLGDSLAISLGSTLFVLKYIGNHCCRVIGSYCVHSVMDGELTKAHNATQAVITGNLRSTSAGLCDILKRIDAH